MRHDLLQESFSSLLAWRSLPTPAFPFFELLLALLLCFFKDKGTSTGYGTCWRHQGDIWMCPSFFSSPFPIAPDMLFLTAAELNFLLENSSHTLGSVYCTVVVGLESLIGEARLVSPSL